MTFRLLLALLLSLPAQGLPAQDLPPGIPDAVRATAEASPIRTWSLPPTRVVWHSEQGVTNAGVLATPGPGQTLMRTSRKPCVLTPTDGQPAGVLLDLGVEIHGCVRIIMPNGKNRPLVRARVRFGESVSEAMSELRGDRNARNDHAARDQVVELPWCGSKVVGPSGFRFVRIDAIDEPFGISEVRGLLQMRDAPWVGSFRCSDERLNRIWNTGAYTVQLNMQEYLWDGIKRDRLVWLGDMHPEVSTIHAVFGFNPVVPDSLDLVRNHTPPTSWMNGISSYSMWWVLIQEDCWRHHGDRGYLEEQEDYLRELLRHLAGFVGDDGRETLDGFRFLDWPTAGNEAAVHEGLQAMMAMTMASGARLMDVLGDADTAALCRDTGDQLARHQPAPSGRKSPAALLALAGLRPADEVAAVLGAGGPSDLSTFYGYYVLEALAVAGEHATALDFIRQYWGGMLDFGATTFWEGFDLEWTGNAGRIDELLPAGKKDLHGDFGEHCYVGFRHSLCHGWASGPTAWLSRHVLGVEPLDPGFRRVRIAPRLGDLEWAEGSYPTPHGPITVRHERAADGGIRSTTEAPDGVVVTRE